MYVKNIISYFLLVFIFVALVPLYATPVFPPGVFLKVLLYDLDLCLNCGILNLS